MSSDLFIEKITNDSSIKFLYALILGGLLPLAFAPFNYYLLAPLSLAGLFIILEDSSAKQAFVLGWLFGIAEFSIGVSWLHTSLHEFSHVDFWVSTIITAIFVMLLAIFPALVTSLSAKLADGMRAKLILFVLFWFLVELLRGWAFTGFPWLSVGYSQTDSLLAGYAPIIGVYGISFLVVTTAAILVLIWSRAVEISSGIIVILMIWGAGGVLKEISWTEVAASPLRMIIVQGNTAQSEKWKPKNRAEILQRYKELTLQNSGVDLAVWPETAVPAFEHLVTEELDDFEFELAKTDMTLLFGIPIMDTESREYWNSAVVRGGDEVQVYKKRQLVPFGEFLPLGSIFKPLIESMQIPLVNFSAGEDKQQLLKVKGHNISVSICYEDLFTTLTAADLPSARVLVNLSNDAWFGDSIASHQHLQIARMRALESGRQLLRSTNTGISAVIDRNGKVIAKAPQFSEFVIFGAVTPYKGSTPYISLLRRVSVL